jgi:hypothetical protein
MREKATELNIDRQMVDFEKSFTNTTKHERKIIRRALELFIGTIEFVPPENPNTTNAEQPQLNTGLLFDLQSVERII